MRVTASVVIFNGCVGKFLLSFTKLNCAHWEFGTIQYNHMSCKMFLYNVVLNPGNYDSCYKTSFQRASMSIPVTCPRGEV